MAITTREAQVLDIIAYNSYQPSNYSKPEAFSDTSSIWSWLITDSASEYVSQIPKASIPGVCSSLVKKGLCFTSPGETRKEDCIGMTREGFNAWQAWANGGGK